MIGPGTGIAPFRAFLHERMATKAPGRNWLFFGHQRRDYDFFYEDELAGMKAAGVLTRLSLAWSRDGDEKFYVQDRMREVGRDLWAWLADGAHVYVCGDAKRMAKDVERALVDIVAAARRALDRRGGRLRRRAQEGRPLSAGRVLSAMNAPLPHPPAVRTTCPYCGVGCGVLARPDGSGGAVIAGDPDHPANFGRLCSKGSALGETLGLDGRLLHPMLRQRRRHAARASTGTPRSTASPTASAASSSATGPDAVAFYLSGQLLTEDYYVANKLMKGFIGSANVDTNSRLCMASSVAGHRRAFGADTVPGMLRGSRPGRSASCWSAPTPPGAIRCCSSAWCATGASAARRSSSSIRAAPRPPRRPICSCRSRRAPTRRCSAACWCISPTRGALDRGYIDAHTTGFAEALARAREIAPDVAATAAATGLDEGDVARFFDLFRATRARRHLLLARRQPVGAGHRQGQRHHQLPSRHRPHRPAGHGAVLAHRPAQRHGRPRGRRARQPARRAHGLRARRRRPRAPLLERAAHGRARGPQGGADVRGDRARRDQGAVGDGDQSGGVAAARRRRARGAEASSNCSSSPRMCCRTTPSNAGAHVLLPAAAWGEKDGTVTNSERRISRQRAFLPLPGEARPDWWIVAEVARRTGLRATRSPIAAPPTCSASMPRCRRSRTTARAISIIGGARRRSPTRTTTRSSRCSGRCRHGRGDGDDALLRRRRLLHAPTARRASSRPSRRRCSEATSAEFPLRLNTGRVRDQWHTMTRTGHEPAARRASAGAVRRGASGRRQGATASTHGGFARVTTAHGACVAQGRDLSDGQQRGSLFAPIHWSDANASSARVGDLVAPQTDPYSGQPEAKATPAAIAPVAFAYARLCAGAHAARAAGRDLVGAGRARRRARAAGSRPTTAPMVWHELAPRAVSPTRC